MSGEHGAVLPSSSCPVWGTPWDWATSGGSPTWPTPMEEVRKAYPFYIKPYLWADMIKGNKIKQILLYFIRLSFPE